MIKNKVCNNLIFTLIFFILIVFGYIFESKNDYKSYARSMRVPTPTSIPYDINGNLKIYKAYNPLAIPYIYGTYYDGYSESSPYYTDAYNRYYVAPSANPVIGRLCIGEGLGLDLAIVMDVTSSLNRNEFLREKEAVKSLIRSFRKTNTRISLTVFAENGRTVYNLSSEFNKTDQEAKTTDWESMCNRIDSFGTGPYTKWYKGIDKATSTLSTPSSKSRNKLMVFFTDGSPNPQSGIVTAIKSANVAKSSGIRILAILIGDNSDGTLYPHDKMRLISGLKELMPIRTGSYSEYDVSNADFIATSFDSVKDDLSRFTEKACPVEISPSPSPSPYPTIVILGSLKKDDSTSTTSCSQSFDYPQGIAPATPGISLLPRDPNATVSCNTLRPGDTTYTCNLSLKNQVNPSISPARTVVLSSGWYPGGSDTYWLGSCSAASCQQSTICNSHNNRFSVNFSQTNPVYNRDMIFPIRDNWFKLKDTSFNSVGTAVRNNIIPPTVSAYDNIDDTTEPYLITREGGLVTTKQNPINIGAANNRYSNNNWPLRGYDIKNKFEDVSTYINYYIKQKADYRTITSVSQIDPDYHEKIYYLNRDLTIDSNNLSHFNRENLILIVDGKVDFALGTGATFAPTKSIAIIAKSIMFYKKTSASTTNTNRSGLIKSAKGIFIADTIDLGGSIDIPIKIKGNLVALTDRVGNSRKQTDTTKPSIFVVFDPKIYLDTIFNIGVQIYN